MKKIREFWHERAIRLAATYLAIIMTLMILFSVIIYLIGSSNFERPLDRQADFDFYQLEIILQKHSNHAKAELVKSLVILNLIVLGAGIWVSLLLARLTLKPIEEIMDQQARFISDASHELRTPLTSLRLTNEIAERRTNFTTKQAQQLAHQNVEQVIKLQNLTDSLLQLARLGQIKAEISTINIKQLLKSTKTMFEPIAKQKNITIEIISPDVKIQTYPELVEQILKILLENAIKYSNENSSIILKIDRPQRDYRLSVIDQGVGICKDHINHIFERFYQVDTARCKSQHCGSGLGLSIAKTISDQFNLGLTVRSKRNKGSTFSFYLKS
ncbi:MAG: ATP-binding protein [Candidatus Saccharibacteria bacterium]|nr:ATP-binding protein [Candidatus Saccharibacteria bacterium]